MSPELSSISYKKLIVMVEDLFDGEKSTLEEPAIRGHGSSSVAGVDYVQSQSGSGKPVVSGRSSDMDNTNSYLRTSQSIGIVRADTVNSRPHNFVGSQPQLCGVAVWNSISRNTAGSASGGRYRHFAGSRCQTIPPTNAADDHRTTSLRGQHCNESTLPDNLDQTKEKATMALTVSETPLTTQLHTTSPQDAHTQLVHPGSDAGSLNVRLGRSTLNKRQGNQSSTLTRRSSTSHTLKRPSDEMHGPYGAAQPELGPTKQPYSPNLRASPGRLHTRQNSFNGYYPFGRAHQDGSKQADFCHPSSPQSDIVSSPGLVMQPATRPITEQQLINEVKTIHAGLVIVERKCVDIMHQQNRSTKRLSDQQWKALVALHRALLQEHHDFFSASQHPSASETPKKLAIEYAMSARMWRQDIHAFLKLSRHRLPHSMEHMLSFIHLAYSMMALSKESVPGFVETWIECLSDPARYRMAIEVSDHRDREIWSNIAEMWYNEAADKSPNVGSIQHHLAVLIRPNIVEQLFYYDKALVTVITFFNTQESIMLLFNMFLKNVDAVQARYPPAEFVFMNTSVQLFTHSSPVKCRQMTELFGTSFNAYMDRTGPTFKLQGPQMALAIFAALLDFGKEDSHLWNLYCRHAETVEAKKDTVEGEPGKTSSTEFERPHALRNAYWEGLTFDAPVERLELTSELYSKEVIEKSKDVTTLCAPLLTKAINLVSSRMGDKNQGPTMDTFLANLYDMSFIPGALTFIEQSVPWESLTLFLNTLGRSVLPSILWTTGKAAS